MNKLCVFAKNKKTYFINRLIEELGQSAVLFDPWTDGELPAADKYLVRTTGVYHSDLDLLILQALPPEKIINPLGALKRFRSKGSQYRWMEEEDFPCLPWISLKGPDSLAPEKFIMLYPEVVVKPEIGQGGWGVEVLTRAGLKSRMKKHDKDYLLQPLIKSAREYRYFFINGEKPLVLERQAKSSLSANFKQQGKAVVSTFPTEYQSVVDKFIAASDAHYGAIDILIDQGQLYILELNIVPGVEQLEQVTGVNVVAALVRSLID
jgi:glutathione synthase/RimK-type ligase-like ATP-grasp enzyme